VCGSMCCLAGVQCTNNACQCPNDKPINCNTYCCPSGTACNYAQKNCKAVTSCTGNNKSCTSDGDCCSHHCTSNLPGIPGSCF
jgi:hypothetical protein